MTTYTLYTTNGPDNQVVARGMTAVDAMDHIVSREEKRSYQVFVEVYEDFLRFDWAIFNGDLSGQILLHATVPATDSLDADKSIAMDMIAVQFLRISHQYWDGRWDTDQTYDEILRYPADREDADRMEREIAAGFLERDDV